MRIHLSVPIVGAAEHEAVSAALDSGWIAPQGPYVTRFEEELAERCGRERAVAVASGSAALHLQLLAAGIGPGDRVACPTLTFAATLNMIVLSGADVVLIDSDATGNMDPDLLAEALAEAEREGAPISAIMPVDLYGRPADHDRIADLAEEHGAVVLVDAAESLGSIRQGADGPHAAGSEGLAAGVSFNGNKIITASAGGAVLTDDHAFADRVAHLATQAREPVSHYMHNEYGYNYRFSNLLAAIGRVQLGRLDEFVAARQAHRARYRQLCEDVPGLRILGDEGSDQHNCWLTVLEIDGPDASQRRAELAEALRAEGIETRRGFNPMHAMPIGAASSRITHHLNGTADRLFETTLAVPSSPASSPADIDEVCERVHDVLMASSVPDALIA